MGKGAWAHLSPLWWPVACFRACKHQTSGFLCEGSRGITTDPRSVQDLRSEPSHSETEPSPGGPPPLASPAPWCWQRKLDFVCAQRDMASQQHCRRLRAVSSLIRGRRPASVSVDQLPPQYLCLATRAFGESSASRQRQRLESRMAIPLRRGYFSAPIHLALLSCGVPSVRARGQGAPTLVIVGRQQAGLPCSLFLCARAPGFLAQIYLTAVPPFPFRTTTLPPRLHAS